MIATTSIERNGVKIVVSTSTYGTMENTVALLKRAVRYTFVRGPYLPTYNPESGVYSSTWGHCSTATGDIGLSFSVAAHNIEEAISRIRNATSYLFRHQQPIRELEAGLSITHIGRL